MRLPVNRRTLPAKTTNKMNPVTVANPNGRYKRRRERAEPLLPGDDFVVAMIYRQGDQLRSTKLVCKESNRFKLVWYRV